MNQAVFFDKDGVINPLVERENGEMTSPCHLKEFKYLPNVIDCFHSLRNYNYLTFIVTNQPALYTGEMSKENWLEMMGDMYAWLRPNKIVYEFDKKSERYKPNNLMLEELIKEFNIDRSKSFMVGDRWKDIVPAYKSSLNTILVGNTESYVHELKPQHVVKDIKEACDLIMEIDNAWYPAK